MKKFTYLIFFLIISSFASNYLVMYKFHLNSSSSCFQCSYIKEILITNVQSLLIIPFVYLIQRFFSNYKTILYLILLSINIFFLNLSVFNSRVSSWSSYSFMDELIAVFYRSISGILISILIFYLFQKLLEKKHKKIL